jgi:hypothetical protein
MAGASDVLSDSCAGVLAAVLTIAAVSKHRAPKPVEVAISSLFGLEARQAKAGRQLLVVAEVAASVAVAIPVTRVVGALLAVALAAGFIVGGTISTL